MKIKYIGHKDRKTDNVADTGTVWLGHGDVQEVEDPRAAQKMLVHKEVWVRDDGSAPPAKKSEPTAPTTTKQPEGGYVLVKGEKETIDLEAMTFAQLKAFAEEHQLAVDPSITKKADLVAAVFKAATSEA